MKRIRARSFISDTAILAYIALSTVIVHLLVAGNYGYFIDEWYTIACSQHLSLAFVDIPPVAPALLALSTAVFGDSLWALHILPSIFSGVVVLLVGLMAKELGGSRFAVVFAGLCAAFVPVWMALGSLFTYDFLDQLMTILLLYAVIRLLKRENPKTWLLIGVIAGVGVMTKPSMVFYIAGIAIALLFTKHRKQYLTRWPWLGALIALVIVSPGIIWQALNGFPIVKYWAVYSVTQAVHVNPAEFVLMQVIVSNLFLLPIWLTGLAYILFGREGRKFRLLGVAFCVLYAVFMVTGAKVYMPAPLYAMLIAGGAVAIEKFYLNSKKKLNLRKILLPAYACVIVLTGAIQAPMFIPVLPVDTLVKYYNSVGSAFGMQAVKLGNFEQNDVLPQYFYDRFDWDTLVRDVAAVYNGLPAAERSDATIMSQNYGCAGSVDFLGGSYGLPKAVCGRMNYYYFSRDNIKTGTWIVIDAPKEDLQKVFGEVTLAAQSFSNYRQPHAFDIYVCRAPKFTVEQAKQTIYTN